MPRGESVHAAYQAKVRRAQDIPLDTLLSGAAILKLEGREGLCFVFAPGSLTPEQANERAFQLAAKGLTQVVLMDVDSNPNSRDNLIEFRAGGKTAFGVFLKEDHDDVNTVVWSEQERQISDLCELTRDDAQGAILSHFRQAEKKGGFAQGQ